MNADGLSLLLVNASSGLALGLSVTVLREVIPSKATDRNIALLALLLIAVWAPWILSGDATIRRFANSAVSIYLCGMFLLHAAYSRRHPITPTRRISHTRDTPRE